MMWFIFAWFYFWIGFGAATEATENHPPSKFMFVVSMILWPCALGYAISKRA